MKDIYIKKLMFITLLFLMISNIIVVNARREEKSYADINEDVTNKKAIFLCQYGKDNEENTTKLYYTLYETHISDEYDHIQPLKPLNDMFYAYFYADHLFKDYYYDNFEKVNYNEQIMSSIKECPKYAYIKNGKLEDTVDFSNYHIPPDKNYEKKTLKYSIFDEIDNSLDEDIYTQIISSGFIKNNITKGPENLILDYILKENKINSIKGIQSIPPFIVEKIKQSLSENKKKYESGFKEFNEQYSSAIENSNLSEDKKNELKDKLETFNKEIIYGEQITIEQDINCKSILTPQFATVLKNIFIFIKYSGLVLLAILSIIDFLNSALTGEQEKLKKSYSNFKLRLIYAILLFFLPNIVNFVLEITEVIPPNECFK